MTTTLALRSEFFQPCSLIGNSKSVECRLDGSAGVSPASHAGEDGEPARATGAWASRPHEKRARCPRSCEEASLHISEMRPVRAREVIFVLRMAGMCSGLGVRGFLNEHGKTTDNSPG